MPTTPTEFQDFVYMIITFTNTLLALFGANCCLYDNIEDLVKAIESIKQGVCSNVFAHNNKATNPVASLSSDKGVHQSSK